MLLPFRPCRAVLIAFLIAPHLGIATAAHAAAPVTTQAAPTPATSACGDGLLTGDETCESCAADCQSSTCKTGGQRKVTIALEPQNGYDTVGAVTVLVPYRHGVLSLPGEKNAPAAKARVHPRQQSAQVFVNDLGYAMRVVVSDQKGFPAGALLDIDVDVCAGATPTSADLGCRVESCAHGGGRLRECACTAQLQ